LAGFQNTTGINNTFVGKDAGSSNTTGQDNSYFGNHTGSFSGIPISTGNRNNFFGRSAAAQEISGNDNQHIGFQAGQNNSRGNRNVLIGSNAGNAIVGNVAATIDNDNIFIGHQSGFFFTGGNSNTFVGSNSGNTAACTGAITNATSIGANSMVLNSNKMILGDNNTMVGIGLSNVAGGPQNKLEINDNINNGSGLRFRQLTSTATPVANPGTGVLGVDVNGDVIYVNGGGGFGQPCGAGGNLTSDMEVPLVNGANEYSMYFTGQSAMTSGNTASVGIGIPCSTPLAAKLDVLNDISQTYPSGIFYNNQYAGRFNNVGSYLDPSGTTDFVGVRGKSYVLNTLGQRNANIGGDFEGFENTYMNIGARGVALTSAQYNTGILGQSYGGAQVARGVLGLSTSFSSNTSIGVQGVCEVHTGYINSIGGYFCAIDASNTVFHAPDYLFNVPSGRIGVYGGIDATSSNSGFEAGVFGDAGGTMGAGGNKWAGYFNGMVFSTGGYAPSDNKLKENIKSLNTKNSIKILSQIKPSSYNFKSDASKSINLPEGNQLGVLSEDVVKVLPELTREITLPARKDNAGNIVAKEEKFMSVNYTGFIPLLISAVQSLDSTNQTLLNLIEKQQKQIDALQNCCNFHSTVSSETPKGNVIDLSDLTIILDQNSPNPFAEQTTITYTIPESVKDAKIMFYTVNGVVLKTVQITDRNHGSLTVYGSNLSEGIYTYTLIADGKIIDSKKMICTKK
jgi:hypothetical protein